MSRSIGDMLVRLGADGSQFRAEMLKAQGLAESGAGRIQASLDKVQTAAFKSRGSLSQLSSSMSTLAGSAGGLTTRLGAAGATLASAFAAGPILGGLALAGAAIAGVVSKYQETKKAAEEARQQQIDAWSATAKEVQKANEQLREQLRLKELLHGLDSSSAKNLRMAEQAVADAEHNRMIAEERVARHAAATERANQRTWVDPADRAAARRELKVLEGRHGSLKQMKEDVEEATASLMLAQRELEIAQHLAAMEEQQAGGSHGLAPLGFSVDGADSGEGSFWEAGTRPEARAVDFARLTQKSLLETAGLEARLAGDRLREIDLRLENERQALLEQREQKGATAEYQAAIDAQITALEAQAAQDRAAVVEEGERKKRAFARQTAQIRAQATETQVDDLRLARDTEIEIIEEALAKEEILEEQARARIAAIREKYSRQIEDATQRESDASQQLIDFQKQKQQQAIADGLAVGVQVGAAMASGIRQSLEEGETGKALLKTLMGIGGILASAFGGPIGMAGAGGLSLMAGWFSEGGPIRGPGGPKTDNLLAWVSPGEFINQAAAVQKFGLPFFESLNQGVLDLSKLQRFANGGAIGGAAGASVVGTPPGSAPTQVFVQAMDPSSAIEAVARVIGPAQYHRGMTRADSREIAMQRRRIQPPRSGR